jgi:hypothetical protein
MPDPQAKSNPAEAQSLEAAFRFLETESVNFAQRLSKDARVRSEYLKRARQFSSELRTAYRQGAIDARRAAAAAHQLRNELLDLMRAKSSDIGRAWAEKMKLKGAPLEALLDKYAQARFGTAFEHLPSPSKTTVFLEIVEAAGRPQARATSIARGLGAAGRSLWLLSIGLAVYEVANADDKLAETVHQGTTLGAGFGGGALGGAAMGLACGPGAPICVALGAFAGGLIGAILADCAFQP